MLASVQSFLEGIIDYAGLFPPANLPLDQALGNYLRYRQDPDSWMLARFICPAARLRELLALRTEIGTELLRLTVLGRGGGKDTHDLLGNLRLDLADMIRLGGELGAAAVENYEVKLPDDVAVQADPASLAALLGTMALFVEEAALPGLTIFLEPPADTPLAAAIVNDRHSSAACGRVGCRGFGWKLRCGGLQASAVPAPAQVAAVLAECCSAGIPWKATAGLHHPLRHFDAGLGTPMHGFVNVFGAGMLIHASQIAGAQVEEMLSDEDPGHFCFTPSGMSWKNSQVGTEAIRTARQQCVTSFGSCSFDEPRADLHALGWI